MVIVLSARFLRRWSDDLQAALQYTPLLFFESNGSLHTMQFRFTTAIGMAPFELGDLLISLGLIATETH